MLSSGHKLLARTQLPARATPRAAVKTNAMFGSLFGGGLSKDRKPATKLAPKEAPPGHKLATFASGW